MAPILTFKTKQWQPFISHVTTDLHFIYNSSLQNHASPAHFQFKAALIFKCWCLHEYIYTHLHELKDKFGTRQRRSTPLHYYCLSKNQHHLKRRVCNTSLNKCFTELMSFDFIYDALLWQEINWDNITCNKHGIAVRAIRFWPITNLSQFCLCTLPQETLVIS